jgi:N-acetylglutamate synthase/N-acetylornithine aminotransferase
MALAGEEMPEPSPQTIDYEELGGSSPEAEIGIRLGRGQASAHVYFSDLTPDYVRLNSEYPT